MALKMKIETTSGIILDNAYIRLDQLGWFKGVIHVTVGIYANQEAALTNKDTVDQKSYNFVPDISENSLNYHTQGYEHLKTQDYFVDAIDA